MMYITNRITLKLKIVTSQKDFQNSFQIRVLQDQNKMKTANLDKNI